MRLAACRRSAAWCGLVAHQDGKSARARSLFASPRISVRTHLRRGTRTGTVVGHPIEPSVGFWWLGSASGPSIPGVRAAPGHPGTWGTPLRSGKQHWRPGGVDDAAPIWGGKRLEGVFLLRVVGMAVVHHRGRR